ncbi:MAG: NHL repeat-containing protein [Coriobacteriia bacterium]|nr:NHL repeat-containing protein [Coriobacteriia bacterium]
MTQSDKNNGPIIEETRAEEFVDPVDRLGDDGVVLDGLDGLDGLRGDVADIALEEEPVAHRRGRIILSIVLVLLILLLLLACAGLLALFRPAGTGDTNEGITWIRSIYTLGANIAGQPQDIGPSSVAVSPDGETFWAVDARHERVIKYGYNGVLKDLITTQADGKPLIYPSDLAVGPDGAVYVTEETYNHVIIYNRDKTYRNEVLIENPTAVAANRDMFVVGGRGGFAGYSLDGNLLGVVGQIGKGENDFDGVQGLTFDDDDNIYVVDTYNNRLSKYDSVGNRIWIVELGYPANRSPASGQPINQEEIRERWPSAMQLPMGLTIDGAGRIIIIDNLDFSIAAFNAEDGSFIDKWGAFGYEDGYLYYPNDIDYEKATDTFVLTEPMRGRIQIIRLPGSGGDWLSDARRMLGDIARSCCWPLIILLLMLLIWAFYKWLSRRIREKNEFEDAERSMEGYKEELIAGKEGSAKSAVTNSTLIEGERYKK